MSRMEIPDAFYSVIFNNQVAQLVDKGLDLKAARQMASEIMGHCFQSRTIAECQENEKDRWEYLEDMSLGGREYRGR